MNIRISLLLETHTPHTVVREPAGHEYQTDKDLSEIEIVYVSSQGELSKMLQQIESSIFIGKNRIRVYPISEDHPQLIINGEVIPHLE
jgi:hypothetical protein